MSVLLFFALIFAIWRTTRLLVIDEFPPVRFVRFLFVGYFGRVDRDGELVGGRKLGWLGYAIAYVWTCPWCMSIWAGALVVWAADWRLSVPYPWLIVALGSLVSGWASALETALEQRWKLRDREIRDGEREPRG